MKICDLCRNTTDQLNPGPKGAPEIETCPACYSDLHVRIATMGREILELREQRWTQMIELWKQERGKVATDRAKPPV